jgi:hypothetical protein
MLPRSNGNLRVAKTDPSPALSLLPSFILDALEHI